MSGLRLVPLLGLCLAAVAVWPTTRSTDWLGRVEPPLPGVLVRLQATERHTLTDSAGWFRLPPGRRWTAWHPDFFIAGADPGRPLRLQRLPDADYPDYQWIDPTPKPTDEQRCGNCHAEIYSEWQSSRHSRSVNSPSFQGVYTHLLREHPDGSGVCASCHAPTARGEAVFDLTEVRGVAARGVHCDYCHKIRELGQGEIGLTHGRFLLDVLRPKHGQLFFGPLDDVDRGEDAYSPFYRDSRYCAACHEGVLFGVRVYSTYSEWLDSPAARAGLHCQHCHMKPTGRMSNIAPGHGGLPRDAWTLGNHRFWDGSQLDMLRQSVRLTLQRDGRRVTTRLVAENVGHRVPTGFVDRQLLLLVEAFDEKNQALAQVGGPRLPPAAGGYAGRAGRIYARWPTNDEPEAPVAFWKTPLEIRDMRLIPHQPDQQRFEFADVPKRLRVRVLHRRFWPEPFGTPGGQSRDLVVLDRWYESEEADARVFR